MFNIKYFSQFLDLEDPKCSYFNRKMGILRVISPRYGGFKSHPRTKFWLILDYLD